MGLLGSVCKLFKLTVIIIFSDIMKAKVKFENEVINTLKQIGKKMDFLEEEIVTIKSWLAEDERLSPYEKKLVNETIKKVKSGKASSMPTLEEMRKRVGV